MSKTEQLVFSKNCNYFFLLLEKMNDLKKFLETIKFFLKNAKVCFIQTVQFISLASQKIKNWCALEK